MAGLGVSTHTGASKCTLLPTHTYAYIQQESSKCYKIKLKH